MPHNQSSRTEAAAALVCVLERCADGQQRDWFAAALRAARAGAAADVLTAYAGASRRLRGTAAALAPDEQAVLEKAGLRGVETWPLDRIARAALVCEIARSPDSASVVETLYRSGDNDERTALLGVLAALPDAGRFASTAVGACRTNVTSVFEAIACENSYPAAHFSEAEFNQMALKAVFTGVAVTRIEGLQARTNAELARMLEAYASERRAAGRSVPGDVDLILSMETPSS